MIEDPEDARETPKTLAGYLAGLREVWRVYRWIWCELLTPEACYWGKRFLVFSVIAVSFQMALPKFFHYVFDGLATRNASKAIWAMAGFVACLVVPQIMRYFQDAAREWLLGTNWGRLHDRLNVLFMEKSMGQHIQQSAVLNVESVERGQGRVTNLQNLLFFEAVPELGSLFIAYGFLWIMMPRAGAILTAVIGFYVLWMLHINQRVLEVYTPIDRDSRRLNRYFFERLNKIERVKSSGQTAFEAETMRTWLARVITADRGFWLWVITQDTFRRLLGALGLAIVVGWSAYDAWASGERELGFLVPLFSWSIHVVNMIWNIGHIEHQLNWNMPAVRAMMQALTIEPDVQEVSRPAVIGRHEKIRVEFDSISHTYPAGSTVEEAGGKAPMPVLKDVSFTIEPGEKVALIGQSGAGKTTIMRLLMRYMDPDRGIIRINGRDLKGVALDSWMRAIGYIPQQAQIFDGTIRSNLIYGLSPDEQAAVSDDKLWMLMRSLKIDFGARLTNGLETRVGRNGIKLSGGEGQRLMIGAAAAKNPQFMVIDEATSNLDSSTEKEVQAGLSAVLTEDVGALIVAHRLSTVRHLCTKFVVLRSIEEVNGHPQIEAIGRSFEELFRISPTFARLAGDQGIKCS